METGGGSEGVTASLLWRWSNICTTVTTDGQMSDAPENYAFQRVRRQRARRSVLELKSPSQDILSGEVTLEARGFPRDAFLPGQPDATLSLSGGPEVYLNWGDGVHNLTLLRSWGTVDLFVLPGFRTRTFVRSDGRLALPLPVDDDREVGYAARWFHTLGDIDLGVSHFWGSSRDPRFRITADGGAPALLPIYE